MMRVRASLIPLLWSGLCAETAQAQTAVPIVNVPAASVASTQTFGAILGLNHLPGGSVLVNDAGRRQVLKLSPSLATEAVIIDSTPGTSSSYGARPIPLIRYLGDSSLFVDQASSSLLVIDPSGRITRAMAAPNPSDLRMLVSAPAYVDPQGRMVYRGSVLSGAPSAAGTPPAGTPPMPLLRADFDRRAVDTLGMVRAGNGTRGSMMAGPDGKLQIKRIVDPLHIVDEYAVLSDGSVAIVRGQDYHVDIIGPDGSMRQGKKLPFDWKRLSDDDKERLRDSVLKAPQPRATPSGAGPTVMSSGGASAGGGASFTIGSSSSPLQSTRITSDMLAGGAASIANANSSVEVIPIKEMADYLPSIRAGAARPDLDGNLWLLPNTSAQSVDGELVYDVVNREGILTHRVRVPKGRSVVGFGAGGVVYLTAGERSTGFTLERSTVPAPR